MSAHPSRHAESLDRLDDRHTARFKAMASRLATLAKIVDCDLKVAGIPIPAAIGSVETLAANRRASCESLSDRPLFDPSVARAYESGLRALQASADESTKRAELLAQIEAYDQIAADVEVVS